MPIIETHDLRKTFRSVKRGEGIGGALAALFSRTIEEKVAVENVNVSIDEGELIGYIGPNGAGKSTTIKMLTGILVPTSGTIRVAGIVPYEKRNQNARNIGVVFGQRSQLYWDLPLRESFELLRAIYSVPRDRYKQNLDHFAEILDLERFMSTPVRQLSLGERMRGDFAAAMMHDPKIVYLDEPTIGLDVVAKEAIREFIAMINRDRGTTVILTTHDLADVERLTPRIILIDEGTVIYDGALERLRTEYGTHRISRRHHAVRIAAVRTISKCEGAVVEKDEENNVVRLGFDRRDAQRRSADPAGDSNAIAISATSRSSSPTSIQIVRKIYLRRATWTTRWAHRRDRAAFRSRPASGFASSPTSCSPRPRWRARRPTGSMCLRPIGSFVVRVYLLRMVWVALYAHNAAPHGTLAARASSPIRPLPCSWASSWTSIRPAQLHDKLHDGSHRRRTS